MKDMDYQYDKMADYVIANFRYVPPAQNMNA